MIQLAFVINIEIVGKVTTNSEIVGNNIIAIKIYLKMNYLVG